MLILKTLQRGEQHGYGISQAIRANSGDFLQVETGSLYPALNVGGPWSRQSKESCGKVR
jgi:PadR family transcriptional regulator PadR